MYKRLKFTCPKCGNSYTSDSVYNEYEVKIDPDKIWVVISGMQHKSKFCRECKEDCIVYLVEA